MTRWQCISRTIVCLCGTALVSTTLAAEHTRTPGVNARQRGQQQRIRQGTRSGELTAEERSKLESEEKALQTEKQAYKADGVVTAAERKDLHQDQNQISKDIYREKHDAEVRPGTIPPTRRPRDPGVNGRQRVQQQRIAQGVHSGELTKDEAGKLRQEEKAIRTEERAYKADGKLTAAERQDLHQDLNQASKDIYQEKHDAETRPKAALPPPAPAPVR